MHRIEEFCKRFFPKKIDNAFLMPHWQENMPGYITCDKIVMVIKEAKAVCIFSIKKGSYVRIPGVIENSKANKTTCAASTAPTHAVVCHPVAHSGWRLYYCRTCNSAS